MSVVSLEFLLYFWQVKEAGNKKRRKKALVEHSVCRWVCKHTVHHIRHLSCSAKENGMQFQFEGVRDMLVWSVSPFGHEIQQPNPTFCASIRHAAPFSVLLTLYDEQLISSGQVPAGPRKCLLCERSSDSGVRWAKWVDDANGEEVADGARCQDCSVKAARTGRGN